jgi:hypothetical protein
MAKFLKAIASLLILIAVMSQNCTEKQPFPKFIGGNIGDTFIDQIDVSGDLIAFAGYTCDSGLTNFSSSIITKFPIFGVIEMLTP